MAGDENAQELPAVYPDGIARAAREFHEQQRGLLTQAMSATRATPFALAPSACAMEAERLRAVVKRLAAVVERLAAVVERLEAGEGDG